MRVVFALVFLGLATLTAAEPAPARKTWKVDDVEREALVYVPTATGPRPVVFVFHGHGGTMKNSANKMAIHKHWPEAICVYPQGLNTPGKLTDPEGKKSGWQSGKGEMKDRDLKFFDTMLASLKKEHQVDEKRIYSTGHSNGGGFTYTLWVARGDVFAAVAPSAAGPAREFKDLKPKPVLHVAGEKDTLVKFEWQQFTIERLKKLNEVDEKGKSTGKYTTEYPSKTGTPVVTVIHPGDHGYPDFAPEIITKFFKEHHKK